MPCISMSPTIVTLGARDCHNIYDIQKFIVDVQNVIKEWLSCFLLHDTKEHIKKKIQSQSVKYINYIHINE